MDKVRVAVIALLCAATAVPCSFDMTPALAFNLRPDAPVELYTRGRLGVLRPAYARSHLVIAYRYLSGNPPTAEEEAGFRQLLEHRLKETPVRRANDEWENARAAVRGVKPGTPPYTDRRLASYGWFVNCADDAFDTAIRTLQKHVKTYGAKHAAVASWLDAQEIVFANCDQGNDVPKPAEAALPAAIRADRTYQIAAAHFYATRWDDARSHFFAIAKDAQSPWRHTARVVAARALLRQSTVNGNYNDSYTYVEVPMLQAEKELRAILADPAASSVHPAARQLLDFALFRTNPKQRLAEAAKILSGSKASAQRVANELADYTYLLDRDIEGSDDMTQWIRAFQNGGDVALKRWRATKKPHWLVAALVHAKPDHAGELLEASTGVTQPTVAFHRARLLIGAGRHDAARAELDAALAMAGDLPTSGRNLMLEQRRGLARTLGDYLRDAQATPVGYEVEQSTLYEEPVPLIPEDAARVMSRSMPLALMAEAAIDPTLPPSVRNPILVAAWTRAVLLEREDVAAQLTPRIVETYPALAPRVKLLQSRFAAADLIVHYGGLQPHVRPLDSRIAEARDIEAVHHGGTENWWCVSGARFYPGIEPSLPLFLEEHRQAAAEENEALDALGSGPSWMLRTILDHARSQPNDPRVPEALSLAILGTRWSCGDANTSALARRAHALLQKQYGATQWAKETKYWYNAGY